MKIKDIKMNKDEKKKSKKDDKNLSEEELIKRDAPSDSEEPLEVSIVHDLKI